MPKEISELSFPDTLMYTAEHIWLIKEDVGYRAGITDFAQDQLGEIVYLDFPETGDHFEEGDSFGAVESLKTVSDLIMPVSGTITAVNNDITDVPQTVNGDPYGRGWMIVIEPDTVADPSEFMNREAYIEQNQ